MQCVGFSSTNHNCAPDMLINSYKSTLRANSFTCILLFHFIGPTGRLDIVRGFLISKKLVQRQCLCRLLSFLFCWKKICKAFNFTFIYFNKLTFVFIQKVFVKYEKAPTAHRFEGVLNVSYMIMFRKNKINTFEYFGKIQALFRWTKLPKGTSTYQDLYDLPFKSSCPYKLIFRKTTVFGHFGRIRPTSGGRFWPELSKGTSTRWDLSFTPITSLFATPFNSSSQ